jgi:hypothetical protein
LLQEIIQNWQLSAENEITFRNIDVSQFQEVIAVINIEETVLEYCGVNGKICTFLVDIIAFLVVYDNWNFVSVCFN